MAQRPDYFRLHLQAPIWRGLVFAGLGQNPRAATYYDASPGRANGTLSGYTAAGDLPGQRWSRESAIANRWALGADGVDDCVNVPLSGISLGAFTLSGWANFSSVVNLAAMVAGEATVAAGTSWRVSGTAWQLRTSGTYAAAASNFAIPVGTWHHWCVSRDPSNVIRYYFNGAEDSPGGNAGSDATAFHVYSLLGFSNGRYCAAKLADLLIWSRALALSEIAAVADASKPNYSLGNVASIVPLSGRRAPLGAASSAVFPRLYRYYLGRAA